MSASMVSFRSDCDNDYAVDARGSFEKINKQNHRPSYRRSSSPGSVNGIHKRRTSRWTWGHGRGARMENARAFARCVIMAVASLCAGSALAGPIAIDTVFVGQPGNPKNLSAPANVTAQGGGQVEYTFHMGKYEVTNGQYAEFLNSVAKTDTFNLYNASMQITRTGSPGSWNYSAGVNANRPINWVSAYDTFRFANWLQNGMQSVASTTEYGAYTMTGTTGQPTRNPGAKYWVPSVNEWYKAAFFNPTLNSGTGGYTTYPVNSNTLTGTTPPGTSTSANIANAQTSSTDVGAYTTASSAYGAYDMAGNVAERLDTVFNSTNYTHATSWWNSPLARASATSANAFERASITGENASTGFRIATAVPEPSTFVLAGMGAVSGLIGWRRRQLKARSSRA